MLIRLLCMKTAQKETPKSPKIGGKGVEVSKTLFYSVVVNDVEKFKTESDVIFANHFYEILYVIFIR